MLCVDVWYAGCSLGRHALQGLDERLLQLLSLGQERGDVKNILIYGRNGVGKSTLIQSILRLGEAPQVGVRRLESCEPCTCAIGMTCHTEGGTGFSPSFFV